MSGPSLLPRFSFPAVLALATLPLVPLASGQESTPDETPDYRKLAQDFARRSANLQEFLDEIPRTSFDPKAIVAEVGNDPNALGAWVASETRWVPYRGVLRGPKGVLMDRRGNVLDRCLLLYELLDLAGHEPRLHRGTLPAGTADALFEALLSIDLGGTDPGAAAQPSAEALARGAERLGIDVATLRRDLLKRQSIGQRAAEQGVSRTIAQSNSLASFIAEDAAAATRDAERADARAMLQDHWWVTVDEDGTTVRLDPLAGSLEDDPIGAPEPSDTYTGVITDELPPSLFHRLEIRFEVERAVDSTFERATAVAHEVRPYEIIGQPIRLMCSPQDVAEPTGELASDERAREVRRALLAADEWVPLIMVGNRMVKANSFRANGTLNPNPQIGVGKKLEKALDALDGLGSAATEDDGQATALYVLYTSTRPGPDGAIHEVEERTIFDTLGSAVRSRLAASGDAVPELNESARLQRALVSGYLAEAAALPCRPSEAYVHGLQYAASIENRPAMLAMLLARAEPTEERMYSKLNEATKKVRSRPVGQFVWGQLRSDYSGLDDRVFVDRINLVSRFHFLRHDDGDDDTRMRSVQGYDVAMNGVGVAHVPDERPTDAALARVRHGVADTVAEATLLALEADADDVLQNTSVAYASATAAWSRSRSAPKAAPANVLADYSRGLAVAAAAPADLANAGGCYWRIDPATGQALGVGPDGRGQVSAETISLVMSVAAVCIYTFCVIRHAAGASSERTVNCIGKGLCLAIGAIVVVGTGTPPLGAVGVAACAAVLT